MSAGQAERLPPEQTEAARDAAVGKVAARAAHMMGACSIEAWSREQAVAWEGLLEVSRRLRRSAEELLERDGLSVSMLGLLGRLLLAEKRTLHQTVLAEGMGLSVSRVSRLVDLLEERGLVERHACLSDARATDVTLTENGAERAARAQRELFEHVQGSFFARLDSAEVGTLAAAFTRLLAGAS